MIHIIALSVLGHLMHHVMYILLLTLWAYTVTRTCFYFKGELKSNDVHVNEVDYKTLKLNALDVLMHRLKYSFLFPTLAKLNTSYLEKMTTKRLHVMELTHPESADCDVLILKPDFLPH